MGPNLLNLLHVSWLFVTCDEHVYQCHKCPNHKGYSENIVIVKSLVKTHIIYLNSEYHVYLCISCIGWKGTYAQLDHSYRSNQQ
jgi:hypothetical protein